LDGTTIKYALVRLIERKKSLLIPNSRLHFKYLRFSGGRIK